MKKYLSFIFLTLAFLSADVIAVKSLPPGAEGVTTGKTNLLIMAPAGGAEPSWLDDVPQLPTDVVVDSRGYVFVKQHPSRQVLKRGYGGLLGDNNCSPVAPYSCPPYFTNHSRLISRFKPDSGGGYTWDEGLLWHSSAYTLGELPIEGFRRGNPSERTGYWWPSGLSQKIEPYWKKLAIDGNDNIYWTFRLPPDLWPANPGWTGSIMSVTSEGVARGDQGRLFDTGSPIGLDIDSSGNIWVTASKDGHPARCAAVESPMCDYGPYYVRKLDSAGTQLAEWEIEATASAGTGWSRVPFGISVYDGKVYVLSQTRDWSGGFGILGKHPGSHPECTRGYAVQVYSATTGNLHNTWYALGAHDIEVNANGVYVVGRNSQSLDPYNKPCGGQVGKYSHSGAFIKRFARQQTDCDQASIEAPVGLTSDADGNIYVAGGGTARHSEYVMLQYDEWQNVKKYSADGDYLATLSGGDNRRSIVKCAIKELLADPTVTSTVNLGLVTYWDKNTSNPVAAKVLVGVSPTGASQIPPLLCPHCPDAYEEQFFKTRTYNKPNQEAALKVVKRYYQSGADGFPSPLDPSSCESHALLLFTQKLEGCYRCGHGHPKDVARDLWDLGVKTYVAGFMGQRPSDTSMLEDYRLTAQEGGTTPFSPILIGGGKGSASTAAQVKGLIKTLVLGLSNSNKRFTGTTPTITSDATGDYIYQSTFVIPPTGQWAGRLVKSSLDSSTAKVGDEEWNAAKQLYELNLGGKIVVGGRWVMNRHVWTAPYPVTGEGWANGGNSKSLVPFPDPRKPWQMYGLPELLNWRNHTPVTVQETEELVKFLYGLDSYDENRDGDFSDRRLEPLGDIYHSEMAIVPPPKSCRPRQSERSQNRGVLQVQHGLSGVRRCQRQSRDSSLCRR